MREKVRFDSGGVECAAWLYPGDNGSCVVMAGGFAVPKEPGTDRFAERFQRAGFTVLAFDYRRLGESAGTPRLVLPVRHQLADYSAALRHAATLPGVDPGRLVAWGFSASGGHVLRVAARHPELAAAIAQAPTVDALAGTRNAARYQSTGGLLRFTATGLADAIGGLFGRPPRLIPLAGPRGTLAMLSTPDSLAGNDALNPGNRYPDWQQRVAARSALRIGTYSPGRAAARIRCPLLVVACADDRTAPAPPARWVAGRAPDAELVTVPSGHYAPFQAEHDTVVDAELDFLRRRVRNRAADRDLSAR